MRKGNEILIARMHSRYCPVGITEMFWRKADIDKNHTNLFHPETPRDETWNFIHHGVRAIPSLYPAGDHRWATIHTSQPEIRRRLTSRSRRGGGTTYFQTWSVEVGSDQEWIHEDTIGTRLAVSRALGL